MNLPDKNGYNACNTMADEMKGVLVMSKVKQQLITDKIALHNRIIMPAMITQGAGKDGKVSAKNIEYYDARSKNGYLSLIITEIHYVTPGGKTRPNQLSLASDDVIEGQKRLVQVIHNNGAKTVAQLGHAGAVSLLYGEENVAPSEIHDKTINPGREFISGSPLTKKGIVQIVRAFAAAAARAKKAGYDGVEIHGTHGHLLNQFYSPVTNHRTDEYGGELENRLRIYKEVVAAVRKAVGEEYPIFLRLGARDYRVDGNQLEDALNAAKFLEQVGVDVLDISGGVRGYILPEKSEAGYFKAETTAIKKAVSIPVILTGGITTLAQAEELLEADAADLIGVGRAILKDAEWAKKQFEVFQG